MCFLYKMTDAFRREIKRKRTPTNVSARLCCGSKPLVGVTRFELVASWTRTMHATKLRYTPIDNNRYYKVKCKICQAFFWHCLQIV